MLHHQQRRRHPGLSIREKTIRSEQPSRAHRSSRNLGQKTVDVLRRKRQSRAKSKCKSSKKNPVDAYEESHGASGETRATFIAQGARRKVKGEVVEPTACPVVKVSVGVQTDDSVLITNSTEEPPKTREMVPSPTPSASSLQMGLRVLIDQAQKYKEAGRRVCNKWLNKFAK